MSNLPETAWVIMANDVPEGVFIGSGEEAHRHASLVASSLHKKGKYASVATFASYRRMVYVRAVSVTLSTCTAPALKESHKKIIKALLNGAEIGHIFYNKKSVYLFRGHQATRRVLVSTLHSMHKEELLKSGEDGLGWVLTDKAKALVE